MTSDAFLLHPDQTFVVLVNPGIHLEYISGDRGPEMRLRYWTTWLEKHESQLMSFLYNQHNTWKRLT